MNWSSPVWGNVFGRKSKPQFKESFNTHWLGLLRQPRSGNTFSINSPIRYYVSFHGRAVKRKAEGTKVGGRKTGVQMLAFAKPTLHQVSGF